MKINLNKPLVIGTMSASTDEHGHHKFTRFGTTRSVNDFIDAAQYIIDSAPDVSAFFVVDVETQAVIQFGGLVFDVLGLKSKRYARKEREQEAAA